MDFLKGYKTVIFNVLVLIAGLAQITDLVQLVAPEYLPAVTLAVAVANLVLRWATDTGIFSNVQTNVIEIEVTK